MAGSVYGKLFRMTTWGESHGKAVGVVLDGCPAGLSLCEEDIQRMLDKRKPGQNAFTTQRSEEDQVEILSGVFEGRTTGTPISMLVKNKDQRSQDYSEIASYYRPGHGDYTFDEKYGFRDYRGGGRSSARETIGRVAAGAVAVRLLNELGIRLISYVKEIGPVRISEDTFSAEEIEKNPFRMPDAEAAARAELFLKEKMEERDSVGGIVECVVTGLPIGIGETVFDKLDASLAKAVMSIGAVKGVEIGDGFQAAKALGSENNDGFGIKEGKPMLLSNHAGGTLGGMSDGAPLILRAAFKPTPSIAKKQRTIGQDGKERLVSIKGRHDPIVAARAAVVVEAMTALTIADLLLENMCANMDHVKKIYE